MPVQFPVDLDLFEETAHTPSLFTLERSMESSRREIRDYCIPANPYFPCRPLMNQLSQHFARAIRYYPAANEQIAQSVARCFGLPADSLVMFNGATELLSWLERLLLPEPILIPVPTFGRWTDVPLGNRRACVLHHRQASNQFQVGVDELVLAVREAGAQSLVLCNPNNPTGACLSRSEVVHLLDELEDLPLVVIDESFLDFSDLSPHPSVADLASERRNLVVMKSLGKNLGLHGVRLGYSVSHPETARVLRSGVPHWNINAIAELLLQLLPGYVTEYEASRTHVISDREYLRQRLSEFESLTVFNSQANFVFCRLSDATDGDHFRNRLLTDYGCLVRHCGNKLGSSSRYLRIAARPKDDVDYLIRSMSAVLAEGS